MQKSKFITLLRTLSPEEFARFSKYVKRSFGSQGVAPLVYLYIKKFKPEFKEEEKKLEMEYAFRKIFKEEMMGNRIKMLNALSDLNLLLKEFLLLEKVNRDNFENQSLWMDILKERGLEPEFSRYAARLHQDLKERPRKGIPDYMKGMIANHYFYYHLTYDKLSENITTLQECGNDLDLFYAVCRLKIACEMANRRNVLALQYDLRALPAVIELAKSEALSKHPLLQLYLSVYHLIANGDDSHFPRIEKMLVTGLEKKIEPGELHTVLSYLHNYAAAQIRKGNEEYWAMSHSLNQLAVSHKIFSESGEMSVSQFNNIAHAACKVKDFTWAASFKKSHRKFLPKASRSNGARLADAIILFESEQYSKAHDVLTKVEPSDLFVGIRAKSMTLISRYELEGNCEEVGEYCLAFKSYLTRKRKSKMKAVVATMRFIHIVKMLTQKKKERNDILQEIEMADLIYFKKWLIEKTMVYKPFKP